MLGISRSSLHHILNGSAIPSVETLARMVSLWNVNLQVTDGSIMTTMALTPRMYRDQRSDHSRVKIFLCHASEDKPKVRQLYVQLRDDGFSAWLDTEDLIPGQDWGQAIRAEVKKSDVVVVCLSKNAVQKSGFIQREISLALDAAEEKPEGTIFIIPALFEDCTVPTRLQKWQWVNLGESAGYEKLLMALRARAEQLGYEVTSLSRKIRGKAIDRFAKSGSFRSAEQNARDLCKYEPFSADEMNRILFAAADNGQIWCAAAIPDILERLVSRYGELAKPEILQDYLDALNKRH